jgi:hypothetical protein
LSDDFAGAARLRYVDFDSPDLADYPAVKDLVEEGTLEPGMIMIEDELRSIWDIPYSRMLEEFEKMGARKAERTS